MPQSNEYLVSFMGVEKNLPPGTDMYKRYDAVLIASTANEALNKLKNDFLVSEVIKINKI